MIGALRQSTRQLSDGMSRGRRPRPCASSMGATAEVLDQINPDADSGDPTPSDER